MPPFVGYDPFHACGGGGGDEVGLVGGGCGDGEGYYEGVLVLEGGDERGVRGVVYGLGDDAWVDGAGA